MLDYPTIVTTGTRPPPAPARAAPGAPLATFGPFSQGARGLVQRSPLVRHAARAPAAPPAPRSAAQENQAFLNDVSAPAARWCIAYYRRAGPSSPTTLLVTGGSFTDFSDAKGTAPAYGAWRSRVRFPHMTSFVLTIRIVVVVCAFVLEYCVFPDPRQVSSKGGRCV